MEVDRGNGIGVHVKPKSKLMASHKASWVYVGGATHGVSNGDLTVLQVGIDAGRR